MKNLLARIFAVFVLLLSCGISEVNADLLTYEIVGDAVTIKDCKETASGALAIPSTHEGRPVTSIGNWAFYKRINLTSVTIPDSFTSIGHSAFQICFNLVSVKISNGVTGIGENDLKEWGETGQVQAAGSSVEYTDWRGAPFRKQYYLIKLLD